MFSYNVVLRDRWIAQQASKLPAGTRLLDVGAGSCPYKICSRIADAAQDQPLQGEQFAVRRLRPHRLRVSDLASIPVPEQFDAVLCTEALNIIPNQIKVWYRKSWLNCPTWGNPDPDGTAGVGDPPRAVSFLWRVHALVVRAVSDSCGI